MNQVFWIPQGCEPPYTVRYGDPRWPFVGDRCANPEIGMLLDGILFDSPLLITGRSGSGKTLLVRSLSKALRPSADIKQSRFISGVDFKRSLHQALDTQTVTQWRDEWAEVPWIALDGLDQLLDDSTAQQFLENLLDQWQDRGATVLITATKTPRQLIGVTPRLASRCASGFQLAASIPGPASRLWLIRRFLAERGLTTTGDHIDQLQDWWDDTLVPVPEIRGLIGDLAIRTRSTNPDTLEQLLVELLHEKAAVAPTIDQISRLVARRYAVSLRELRGNSRKRATVRARAAAIWLARKWTGQSYSRIGEYFHKRDHTTILHACRTFQQRLADVEARRALEQLEEELAQTSPDTHSGKPVASLSTHGDAIPTTQSIS